MDGTRHRIKCFQIALLSIAFLIVSLFYGCCPRHENPFLQGLSLKKFVQHGPTEVYNRDNIFDYIDGEAEAYLPLGFRLLYTERYRKPGTDKLILVEAYDMGFPNGAQGIFDVYSRKGGLKVEGLGNTAWTDNSIILFRRDRYFFRIWPDPNTETNTTPELKDLLELSRSIDRTLRGP
jgi:hypothetical protein